MLKHIPPLFRRLHTRVRLINLRGKLRAARFDMDVTRAELVTAPVQIEFLTKHIQALQAEINRLEGSR